MRHTFYLLVVAIGVAFLGGCKTEDSSAVDQKRIYTIYELTYDANDDITYARAQFRFGNATGTLLKLSSNSSVKFNGSDLTYVELLAFYEKKISGQVTSGNFIFTDSLGKSYTNTILGSNTIQLPASLTQFKRNQSTTVAWAGIPQLSKETVLVTLHKTNTTDFYFSYGNGGGATDVIVPAQHVNNFAGGSAAETFIERFMIDSLDERPDAGGFSKVSFKGLKKSVSVVD